MRRARAGKILELQGQGIAACALRHGLSVVHVDRDYEALARIAPLSQRALHASA